MSIGASSAEIKGLLKAWSGGDQAALERLAEQVYPELRRMARRYMKNEHQPNTLQATALVHEAYFRLVDVTNVEWQERAQFFAMAAQMMRRILVDAARARGSQKRGGVTPNVNIDETAVLSPAPDRSILAVDGRDWDLARAWLLRELSRRIERPTAHDPRAFPAN